MHQNTAAKNTQFVLHAAKQLEKKKGAGPAVDVLPAVIPVHVVEVTDVTHSLT